MLIDTSYAACPTPPRLNSHPERLGDLGLGPSDLGTGAEGQPWLGHVNVGASANFRCRVMGKYASD